ncbi:MAG: DUF3488 and transglutaminase-like domain-containing protein [Xanthomonadales bacterium]|nr:DUF3488 and transglutaminase-like domain-containing protein [Xanthomonadales bacterium]
MSAAGKVDIATGRRLDGGQFSLCCLTVLAALLPHGSWLPLPFLILLLVLIGLRWLQRWRWPRVWPWWFRNGLMVALLVAAWTSIGTISGTQGAGFLAAMLVSKLYEAERARDARSVATFASFLVMAQFLFHTQLWAMLAGVPGLVLALATLAALNEPLSASLRAWRRPIATASRLLLLATPIALIAFALFPRLESPLWGNTGAFSRGQLGLSDRMEPGQIGAIALDDRPAMRVRFPDGAPPPPALRYFRGLTLWQTDGRSWTRPGWMQTRLDDLPPVPDYGIRHEITLERDAAPWLPALDRPLAAPAGLAFAMDRSLPIPRQTGNNLRYEVVSDPTLTLEPFQLRPYLRSLALNLPEDRNPRSLALALQLRSQYPDDRQYAQRLLDLFREDFSYTLEPPPLGAHSVDEFLFDTQSGYCEHYASAYATLLRAAGIPARVALGFQGGYWNSVGEHLVVRRSDAHAWVELWIQGSGWLRADPTAAVAPDRIERGSASVAGLEAGLLGRPGSAWTWLRDRWDFMEMRWTDWIVNYQVADQSALLQRLLNRLSSLRWTLTPAGIVAGAVLGLLLWLGWRRYRSGAGADDPQARWYARFRAVLASVGVDSRPSEPALQLAARAGRHYPALAGELTALARDYQLARYGPADRPLPAGRTLARLWLHLNRERLRRRRQTPD